jgi:MoaA/NifB/PqqE/SkfB family radical SAM enzyme
VKLRKEPGGLHFYDRVTGVHVLLDERPVPPEQCDGGPSVLSVALTNACDLECEFCYAPKTPHSLRAADVLEWCVQAEALGTLEVAFGGGEPTLYVPLPELCRTLWSTTSLGISITTHGHHLSRQLVDQLVGNVSIIRVSIDAPEPTYSAIRGRTLDALRRNLEYVRDRIPFGINTVVNRQTISLLEQLADCVVEWGSTDWLLLPEVSGGQFTLSDISWYALDDFITRHSREIDLRVTTDATKFLSGPFLLTQTSDFEYVHISADRFARLCSYSRGGINLQNTQLPTAFRELRGAQPGTVFTCLT